MTSPVTWKYAHARGVCDLCVPEGSAATETDVLDVQAAAAPDATVPGGASEIYIRICHPCAEDLGRLARRDRRGTRWRRFANRARFVVGLDPKPAWPDEPDEPDKPDKP